MLDARIADGILLAPLPRGCYRVLTRSVTGVWALASLMQFTFVSACQKTPIRSSFLLPQPIFICSPPHPCLFHHYHCKLVRHSTACILTFRLLFHAAMRPVSDDPFFGPPTDLESTFHRRQRHIQHELLMSPTKSAYVRGPHGPPPLSRLLQIEPWAN